MKKIEPLKNQNDQIKKALENPIASPSFCQLVAGKKSVCIVICDKTRPVPNKMLLEPLLKQIEHSGIAMDKIDILIATGLHRPILGNELIELVGESIVKNYHIVNHDARKKRTLQCLGKTSPGTAIFLNSLYVKADSKITTRLIEPHMIAGFSGGRKLICPGIARLEAIRAMHRRRWKQRIQVAGFGNKRYRSFYEENFD